METLHFTSCFLSVNSSKVRGVCVFFFKCLFFVGKLVNQHLNIFTWLIDHYEELENVY